MPYTVMHCLPERWCEGIDGDGETIRGVLAYRGTCPACPPRPTAVPGASTGVLGVYRITHDDFLDMEDVTKFVIRDGAREEACALLMDLLYSQTPLPSAAAHETLFYSALSVLSTMPDVTPSVVRSTWRAFTSPSFLDRKYIPLAFEKGIAHCYRIAHPYDPGRAARFFISVETEEKE